MRRGLSFIFILVFAQPGTAADFITFRIYEVGSGNSQFSEHVVAGIEAFTRAVERHCQWTMAARVDRELISESSPTQWRSQASFHHEKTFGEKTFPFRFFQFPFFQLIYGQQLQRRGGEVSLFVVHSLGAHCGFAFPEEQFAPAQSRGVEPATYRAVVDLLTDRLLLARDISFRDCPPQRLVAHELAHVFVREPDGREHRCFNGQSWGECPPDNLILSHIYRDFDEPTHPGRVPRGGRGGWFDDPMSPRPAMGTALDSYQCERVLETYQRLLAE